DTSCGVDLHTSRGASGVDSHTESYLLSGLQADLVVGTNEVSATGPGADAPAEAGGFERVWRAYKKHGNKQASRKAFEAIPNPEVDLITSRAASWAASAKPGQRRM